MKHMGKYPKKIFIHTNYDTFHRLQALVILTMVTIEFPVHSLCWPHVERVSIEVRNLSLASSVVFLITLTLS